MATDASTTPAPVPTDTYVLVSGNHHTADPKTGEIIWKKAGDLVELTLAQAKAFKDKIKSHTEFVAEQKHSKRIAAVIAAEKAKIASEEADAQAKLADGKDEDEDEDEEEDTKAKPATKPAVVAKAK
jgi:PHD/YefM family antitoxin component YafN of YafNO toxin-antitoxin module